jgi:hypothetical protein
MICDLIQNGGTVGIELVRLEVGERRSRSTVLYAAVSIASRFQVDGSLSHCRRSRARVRISSSAS